MFTRVFCFVGSNVVLPKLTILSTVIGTCFSVPIFGGEVPKWQNWLPHWYPNRSTKPNLKRAHISFWWRRAVYRDCSDRFETLAYEGQTETERKGHTTIFWQSSGYIVSIGQKETWWWPLIWWGKNILVARILLPRDDQRYWQGIQ